MSYGKSDRHGLCLCALLFDQTMQNIPGLEIYEPSDVLILGVGNILWADEGFGVRAVEAFNAKYRVSGKAKIADGGTLGMYLLDMISDTKDLLLFDCADLHAEPGTLRLLEKEEVKFWSSTKISPHQTGLNELLALAQLQGKEPERIAVVAVQPKLLEDYGGSLTEPCNAVLPEAVETARRVLVGWGYEVTERPEGEVVAPLGPQPLNKHDYEAQRPTEASALREGDARFFPEFK